MFTVLRKACFVHVKHSQTVVQHTSDDVLH